MVATLPRLSRVEAELLDHAVADGAEEAHGEEDEIDVEGELGAGLRFKLGRRADADGVDLLDVAVLVAGEFDGVDGPVADAAFFVRAFSAELQGPERPGRGGGTALGRLGHDFELVDAFCALAMAGAEAVGAGVAAADDEDALAGGEDGACGLHVGEEHFFRVAFVAAILLGQELHGEVDAVELAAGDGEVAGLLGAAAEEDGVETLR